MAEKKRLDTRRRGKTIVEGKREQPMDSVDPLINPKLITLATPVSSLLQRFGRVSLRQQRTISHGNSEERHDSRIQFQRMLSSLAERFLNLFVHKMRQQIQGLNDWALCSRESTFDVPNAN
ncbi:uncharacterized protein LOC113667610 [Pocillopora damicornis]|uniref:uncharacterized protein LOC113667610 n=1 Tax=Pocillopora damicornis TaxID=46731 RepID=UPI000F55878B|nr:uncharacterized protein LOC113667610 [Pocillopora damicornis]